CASRDTTCRGSATMRGKCCVDSHAFRDEGKRREYPLAHWTIHGTVKVDESSAEPEVSQGTNHQRISCRSFATASRTSQSFTTPFQSPLASTLPSGLIASL